MIATRAVIPAPPIPPIARPTTTCQSVRPAPLRICQPFPRRSCMLSGECSWARSDIPNRTAHGEERVSDDQGGFPAIDVAQFAILSDRLFGFLTSPNGEFDRRGWGIISIPWAGWHTLPAHTSRPASSRPRGCPVPTKLCHKWPLQWTSPRLRQKRLPKLNIHHSSKYEARFACRFVFHWYRKHRIQAQMLTGVLSAVMENLLT